MEVNNIDNHGQIIYPQNIKKYTGSIQKFQSRAKNGNNKVFSFKLLIRTANFKYYKTFSSRVEAKFELIRQNIENKLEIRNIMYYWGDHYKVKLPDGKEFLADKIDLHFIESYLWYSNNKYVNCRQNKRHNGFHNIILDHTPTNNSSVDHINQNPLDNRRKNLTIATKQVQSINQTPRNGTNQLGVYSNKKYFIAFLTDEFGVQKTRKFSINKYSYDIAKQMALDKRLEIELSLSHYRIALHNLPPIEHGAAD